jgi:hypothetical protein
MRKTMSYDIECEECEDYTYAKNIVDLIDNHTDENGFFVCEHCSKSKKTFIHKESEMQEKRGQKRRCWERWIKGVVKIDSGIKTFSPYVFYIADDKNAKPSEFRLHFNYYKDTRPQGGSLKHGHGPGGAPVLEQENLFFIIEYLIKIKALSINDLKKFIKRLEK